MTTSQREAKSTTTPELVTNYRQAKPQRGQPIPSISSVEVVIPPLVNTVFARSNKPRKVVVNPARIEASLDALKQNRKLQKMGLG